MTHLTTLSGLGQKSAEKLAHLGIYSQEDLLLHLPFRYQDKRTLSHISSAQVGDEVVLRGRIVQVKVLPKQLICMLEDEKDNRSRSFSLRFFNYTAYMRTSFVRGHEIECFGELRLGRDGIELFHPEYKILSIGQPSLLSQSLIPVYHTTGGIFQANISKWIKEAVQIFNAQNETSAFKEAINTMHFPTEHANEILEFRHPLQEYLITEELASRKLLMLNARKQVSQKKSYEFSSTTTDIDTIIYSLRLSYALTPAQYRAIGEITHDMTKNTPMRRLLQGDVGCGKTIVSLIAALIVQTHHKQIVVMAPTTILAKQHYEGFSKILAHLNIKIVYLSSKTPVKEKKEALMSIALDADIIVGTHALITPEVEYRDIGLCIIDEQHKFGVKQRLELASKSKAGYTPHQLLVSATPIPRSLVMTAYGELDVSIIDELPKGRAPINTLVMSTDKKAELIAKLGIIITKGQQIYWVCSLIEESEHYHAQPAVTTYEELCMLLPDVNIGLVHSKTPKDEKAHTMKAFKEGEVDILVATTVIEVGVDVPNASCMVIENAEKMGLSTLHQLRGRVGRGNIKSTCILLYQPPLSEMGEERLRILRDSTDGFIIARKDLELRGSGEVLGTAQSGLVSFKIANIVRDEHLLEKADTLAKKLYTEQSELIDTLIERWTNPENREYLMG